MRRKPRVQLHKNSSLLDRISSRDLLSIAVFLCHDKLPELLWGGFVPSLRLIFDMIGTHKDII